MPELRYVLTEEEYNELVKKKEEPNDLLRDTNKNLKKKIEELEKRLSQGSFDNIKVDAPFIIEDEIIKPGSHHNFVMLYNRMSRLQNKYKASLKVSDEMLIDFMEELVDTYYVAPYFKSALDVKRYRQNLIKSNLYRVNPNTSILEKV